MSLSALQIYYYPGHWIQCLPAHTVCTISTPWGAFQPGVLHIGPLFYFPPQIHSPCTSLESHTIRLRFRLLLYLFNSDLLYYVTQDGILFTRYACYLGSPHFTYMVLPCMSYLYISKLRAYFTYIILVKSMI